MNIIQKGIAAFFLLLGYMSSYANDGSFRVRGNQLIPMYETDISVRKEILTIRRINKRQAEVDVYYEFFNPKEDKELEVGFEALPPQGDVDTKPVNGEHPYIDQFTVTMNDMVIPYKVSIVNDSLYYKNGKYKSMKPDEILKELDESEMDIGFFYVYHFRALFKKGLNIIRHKYVVDLSNSVEENYSFDYVLTAAGRWANKQIDDFTLQIDMGEFQDLTIQNTFFKNTVDWKFSARGKQIERIKSRSEKHIDDSEFFIQNGMLVFEKRNFKPVGELYIHSYNNYFFDVGHVYPSDNRFNYKRDLLPFSIDSQDQIDTPANELSKTILKNLPFARRGYIFKSPELKTFYERQNWYNPDATYVPDLNQLSKSEQEWFKRVSEYKN
jgi:YARHG domain